jgi:hypothetical protein
LGEYEKAAQTINRALTRTVGNKLADLLMNGQHLEEIKQNQGQEKSLAFLSYDVDRIKEIVFSSTKPLEVNGASEIINDLSDECPTDNRGSPPYCSIYRILQDYDLSSDHVLFSGGGSGIILLPTILAEPVAREIQERFSKESVSGTCSVIYHCLSPHELVSGLDSLEKRATIMTGVDYLEYGNGTNTFRSLLRLLADKMRQEKETKMRIPATYLPGFIKRCKSCGTRPASEYDQIGDSEDAYLCNSCYQHRQRGREERHRPKLAVAKTIEEITGGEGRGNYVAAVYADANGMGNMLLKLKKMEELYLFSRIVTRVVDNVRDKLVVKHDLERRYQAPVVGGDDVLLIVPATNAVEVAIDLHDLFRVEIKSESAILFTDNRELANLIEEITLSIGFVIVPQHFNIRFLIEYAEVMLNEAKKGYRLKKKECVDFLVLTDGSPLSTTPSEVRERFYVNKNKGTIALTRRPLSVEELKELAADIKNLKKNVSRAQLKNMQNLLYHEPPAVARLNLQYQWVRIANKWGWLFQNDKMGLNYWLQKFLEEDVHRPGYYRSSISDIMELYSFVEA